MFLYKLIFPSPKATFVMASEQYGFCLAPSLPIPFLLPTFLPIELNYSKYMICNSTLGNLSEMNRIPIGPGTCIPLLQQGKVVTTYTVFVNRVDNFFSPWKRSENILNSYDSDALTRIKTKIKIQGPQDF